MGLKKKGPVPGTPQARNGGLSIKAKYGEGFFSEIGKKGGRAIKEERHGVAHFERIGKLGGQK